MEINQTSLLIIVALVTLVIGTTAVCLTGNRQLATHRVASRNEKETTH
jgi:hypothetical protein